MSTPGPWAQAGQRVNGPQGVLVAWCGEASSIDVAGGFYAVSKTEAEANARLIAAAPDLLAAVRAAHDYLRCIPEAAAGARRIAAAPDLLAAVRAAHEYLWSIPEPGGDDDAVRITRQCAAALARVEAA